MDMSNALCEELIDEESDEASNETLDDTTNGNPIDEPAAETGSEQASDPVNNRDAEMADDSDNEWDVEVSDQPVSEPDGETVLPPDMPPLLSPLPECLNIEPDERPQHWPGPEHDPYYRRLNLASNKIRLEHPCSKLPDKISQIIREIDVGRDSPNLPGKVAKNKKLQGFTMEATAYDVEKYFEEKIFSEPGPNNPVIRAEREPMARHGVPNEGVLPIKTPVPSMLYGYKSAAAFPKEMDQIAAMGAETFATIKDLVYPFLVVQFSGDGPGGSGNLWAATNHCLAASASCVLLNERLNERLVAAGFDDDDDDQIISAVFSVAMNGTEARLFVTWKDEDGGYCMQYFQGYLLQQGEGYNELRAKIRTIILDWGAKTRRNWFRAALRKLMPQGPKKKAPRRRDSRSKNDDGDDDDDGSDDNNSNKGKVKQTKKKPRADTQPAQPKAVQTKEKSDRRSMPPPPPPTKKNNQPPAKPPQQKSTTSAKATTSPAPANTPQKKTTPASPTSQAKQQQQPPGPSTASARKKVSLADKYKNKKPPEKQQQQQQQQPETTTTKDQGEETTKSQPAKKQKADEGRAVATASASAPTPKDKEGDGDGSQQGQAAAAASKKRRREV